MAGATALWVFSKGNAQLVQRMLVQRRVRELRLGPAGNERGDDDGNGGGKDDGAVVDVHDRVKV